jgi:hypothetical protein
MTTTTETASTFALTAQHVKVLRTADSVCFDHVKGPNGGTGQVRCIKRTPKDPWEKEKEIAVPAISTVGGEKVRRYGEDPNEDYLSCFEMLHGAAYCEEWKTITSLLRVGDELELRWLAGDGNGYLSRARVVDRSKDAQGNDESYQPGLNERLYHDRLYVHIVRGGKRKYSFLLANSICPNNTARMVRGL